MMLWEYITYEIYEKVGINCSIIKNRNDTMIARHIIFEDDIEELFGIVSTGAVDDKIDEYVKYYDDLINTTNKVSSGYELLRVVMERYNIPLNVAINMSVEVALGLLM